MKEPEEHVPDQDGWPVPSDDVLRELERTTAVEPEPEADAEAEPTPSWP
jgi:hypothetical protein